MVILIRGESVRPFFVCTEILRIGSAIVCGDGARAKTPSGGIMQPMIFNSTFQREFGADKDVDDGGNRNVYRSC
jgi:hypothetical protein